MGLQELIALGIVIGVVVFVLWRRWRRGHRRAGSCDGCDNATPVVPDEKPVHFYRRRR